MKSLAIVGGSHTSAAGRVHVVASQLDNLWAINSAVFSTNILKSEVSRKYYGLTECKIYENISTLLSAQKKVAAISIVSPTNIHVQQCEEIIKLDKKVEIYCEKAIATSVVNAESIKKLLEKHKNQEFYCFFNYTGYPMLREIKKMVEAGTLGEILAVDINMPQQTFAIKGTDNKPIEPQRWRLDENACIPHVSLDLGTHVVNLGQFLTGKKIVAVSGVAKTRGSFENIIDYISANMLLEGGIPFSTTYGKCFLGHDNGLRVNIYGSKSSVDWYQKNPDTIKLSKCTGEIIYLTLMDPSLIEANKGRYSRFKSGHPTGFIEAFANYYADLHNKEKEWIFGIDEAIYGLKVLSAIHASSEASCMLMSVK